MNFFQTAWWRRGATIAMLLGLLAVVVIALFNHPVAACKAFAAGLVLLALYRLWDRSDGSWLAVRGWRFDVTLMLALAFFIYWLSPYGGVVMPSFYVPR